MPTEDPPKMKIVCDSCGAKYSIADEKVAGKVFKIRCKKCSNTIVVRGDAEGHDDDEATRVFDHGADAIWHVVVDGQQQGPYAPIQIVGLLNTGRIDWEAYVWKEGFDGWLPLRQVDELVQAIGGDGPPPASSEGEAPTTEEAAPAEDDPFASSGGEFSGGAAASAPSQDLFASSAPAEDPFASSSSASPFGETSSDVVSSPAPAASSPRVSESQAMTGARNENSVLFSLSNLQALAGSGSSSTPSASSVSRPQAAPAGAASGDASGLIDIRNLASANAAIGGPKKESAESAVDELLSVGTGAGFTGGLGGSPLLGGSPALGGSPVLGGSPLLGGVAEEQAVAAPVAAPKSSKLMPILATVGFLGLGAAVAFLAMREPQTVVVEKTIEVKTPVPVATAEQPAEAAGAAAAPEPSAPAEAAKPEETKTASSSTSKPASSSSSSKTSTSSSSSSTKTASTSTSSGSSMTSTSSSSMTSTSSSSSGSKDIGSLLDRAVSGSTTTSTTMSSSSSGSSLPDTPDRSAVASALGSVAATVRVCGNGEAGTARAAVTFSGSSGAVSNVSVTGVSDSVAKCVERAVKGVKVPPFRQSTFNVTYPYRVQ